MSDRRQEMIGWLQVILEPGQVVELRAIKVPGKQRPHTESGFFDYANIPLMVDAAISLTMKKAEGVYFTLNPLNPAILNRRTNRVAFANTDDAATDQNVLRRRWLLVDCDPVKADKKVSSSQQEKDIAEMLACEVKEWLSTLGWPDPVEADSGNGAHLLYRIDLPASDDGLVKKCLTALDEKFSREDVKVDAVPHNQSRICKLYGTVSRKGDHSEARPHRTSKVNAIPDPITVVSTEQLKALAAMCKPPATAHTIVAQHQGSGPTRGLDPRERAKRYVMKIAPAVSEEGGHDQTWHVAMVLINGFGLSVADAKPIFEEWNLTCLPPWSESDLMHKLNDADEHRSINAGYLLGSDNPWTGTSPDIIDLESFGIVADVKPVSTVPAPLSATGKGFSLDLISSEELSAKDFTQRFLINGVLVANQPCIIGGKSKTLKTSIAIDLAFALGSGTRFLGEFNVPETIPVMVLSGESGGFTIQETARRIADRRGWPLSSANIFWGFKLPQLSRHDHLMVLDEAIRRYGIKCAIIDPAYLCLMGGDTQGRQASNVFDMGSLLQPLGEIGQHNKCTVCLIHHHKKGGQFGKDPNAMPELEDLAFAGFTEWARQWLLIGRRSAYDTEKGLHELWLNVGGSAGHHGTWAVDIDEGTVDEHFKGRYWKPSVKKASEAIALKADKAQMAKREEKRDRVVALLTKKGLAMTPRQIRDLLTPSIPGGELSEILEELHDEGVVMPCPVTRNKRQEDGWIITPKG